MDPSEKNEPGLNDPPDHFPVFPIPGYPLPTSRLRPEDIPAWLETVEAARVRWMRDFPEEFERYLRRPRGPASRFTL
jgi:hypothetical protein